METPGGNLIGAASEAELVISGGPAALEINLGGSSGGPGIVRIYDAKSGTVRVARRLSGESSLRLDAGAGPQIVTVEEFAGDGGIVGGSVALDSLDAEIAPVLELTPTDVRTEFRPVAGEIAESAESLSESCATPIILVAGGTASGDATPAEADYASRYLAHRLTLANLSVRIYQSSDLVMAREASKSLLGSSGVPGSAPLGADLILGTVVSRDAEANLLIEVFLTDAKTGGECSRWQLAPKDDDAATFAIDDLVTEISPLDALLTTCGWSCHPLSFELEVESGDGEPASETRSVASAGWRGWVSVMPDATLAGSGTGFLAFSRQTVRAGNEDEGPQICGETYSHPGDIAIAISGRKVGDSLRIGFAPVTRGGTIVEICGGESTVFRADLAAAILAPWGRQPAVLSAKAGAFFQYRADNAASRAILTIDDAVTAQTP